jgi:Amt family ammonium transporter
MSVVSRTQRCVRPVLRLALCFAFVLLSVLRAQAQTAAAPAPARIDTGDTAWMLMSSALVLLMTPGLALFYGGMVRGKNVLNVLMQSFVAIAIVTLLWVVVGYSLAFAPGNPFIGSLGWLGLRGVGQAPHGFYAPTTPHLVFMVYQMMFAIITPALISGAVAERMKFSAYILFIAIWSLLVYAPMAHMVWGQGGFLADLGSLDFAGGTVVHITSGVSALVLALFLGKRRAERSEDLLPHNLPMTLTGTALLWFGWFGFNAGSALASGGLTANAFVVTHIAAATAALVWMSIEWVTIKQPTALGFASGAVAGLVAITPASGFVTPLGAIAIGGGVSFCCLFAIKMKARLGYDDTLDVFGVHGVGGIWGALATGLFACASVNPAALLVSGKPAVNGLFYGGGLSLLGKQAAGVGIAITLAVTGTVLIATLLRATIGLRVSAEDEEVGLDLSQHGEAAYTGATVEATWGTHAGEPLFGDGGLSMGHTARKHSTK